MPELPEVETVRRKLEGRLEGRTIESVEVVDPRFCAPQSCAQFELALTGVKVANLGRRGKYLLLELDQGAVLVMHLRMTGALLYDPLPDQKYVRARFALDDGHMVVFSDPRRFGTAEIFSDQGEVAAYLDQRLGPEPFTSEFTAEYLKDVSRSSRAPLKSFLLNQRNVAGIGNIYADEALFRAGIHPLRPAGQIDRKACVRLHEAIGDSLQAGIDSGGSTIDDFRDPDGVWGSYQSEFLVHRREGLPCPDCSTTIVKLTVGGRGTYCCEHCQPRPRVKR